MQRLCLSPLTITSKTIDGTLFSGSWCLIEKVVTAMEKDNISCNVVQLRKITKKDYYKEAELCIKLYDKYIPYHDYFYNLLITVLMLVEL